MIESKDCFLFLFFFSFSSSLLVINKPLPNVIMKFGKLLFPEIDSIGGERDQLLTLACYLFYLGKKLYR